MITQPSLGRATLSPGPFFEELIESYLRDNRDGTLTFIKVIAKQNEQGEVIQIREEEGHTVKMPWLLEPKQSKNPSIWQRLHARLVKTNQDKL